MNSPQLRRFDGSFGSDLRAMFALLRQKIWLIIACVLAAGIAGAAYIIYSPKIYSAQAVIQVEQGRQKILKTDDLETQDLKAEDIPKTIEQSLTSPELLLGLITRNHLDKDPAFLPTLKRPVSDSKIAEELAKHISAQVRRGTRLIDIKVKDRSPLMAQKIVDLLVKEFIRESFRQHTEASEMIYNYLFETADRMKARLAKSEEALQTYKEQHQAVGLGEKDNIVVEKLGALNRMVTEAKAARLKLEADYAQINKFGNDPVTALLAIPSIANAPIVVEAQNAITQKESDVAALTQKYRPGRPIHPAMRQLQELKAVLDRMILKAADELKSAYDSAAATEHEMEKALQEQEKVALELNKTSIPYNALRQEADSNRELYESVLTRLKETDVTKEVSQDAIRLVSHPLLPERPVWPEKKLILLLSLFGGVALGCGLALLSRVLNVSLRTVEEGEWQLGVPALGVIPKCARPKWLTDDLVLITQPGSATAESFRSLRTSLSLLGKSAGHRAFLFTSAVVSEGKSFCAINCAVSFAQMGLKTLLIDADLRSPAIGGIFFNGAPVQGLTEVLRHRTDLDHVVWPTNIDKLSVLCAGIQLNRPAELLAGEGFDQLIKNATEKFDRVVVDSAPIDGVADTLMLAAQVQATCLVVSAKTSAEVVSRAARKLGDAGSTLVGFIFNRVSRQQASDYGYRYSRAAWARAGSGIRKKSPKPPLQLEWSE